MIDCRQCRHYYVTWDKRLPHGCRAMGFKSLQLPAIVVRMNSQEECLKYQRKATPEKNPNSLKP